MPAQNGHPNTDRSPVPGSHSRSIAGPAERDRLDAAREHARKKILDRLVQQAMQDLSDPAVIEKMPIDVEGEAEKLAPAVMDAVKHRLMDRIAGDVVEMIAKGEAFRSIVDEATRRTEHQMSSIVERVVTEITDQLTERVSGMLSDTASVASRVESAVDKDSEELTDVAHVVCGRIEESIKEKALEMASNADVTAELIYKRVPEDHPALEAMQSALSEKLLNDVRDRSLEQFTDADSAAARALSEVDRDADSMTRVRELLAEQLLVMVMGDALDDLGRKLASTGPRDSMVDRVFQNLTGPGAELENPVVGRQETEPVAMEAQAEPDLESEDPEPDTEDETTAFDADAGADEPLSPESVETIVAELEFETVVGSDAGGSRKSRSGQADGTLCYVYGVVRASDWSDVGSDLPEGVEEGSAIRTVKEGKLLAVVSDVPSGQYGANRRPSGGDGADWTRTRLRRHARVLGQIGHRITVLPLPFGSTHGSEDGVAEMLREKGKTYGATLERLSGRVEWTVRMVRDDYRMLERMVDLLDADGMDLSSLPEDVATELDSALAECEEPGKMMSVVTSQCVLHARAHLELYADASADRGSAAEGSEDATVLNRAYLVPRDGAKAFRKALESLASQWTGLGIGFEVSGPWPPYHFAEGSVES